MTDLKWVPPPLMECEAFRERIRSKLGRLPVKALAPKVSPPSYSLQQFCPPAFNQADMGSCTANAIAGCILTCCGQSFLPSRLFLYTEELLMENPNQPIVDRGADAADGCAVLASIGCCSEVYMPYVVDSSGHASGLGQLPSAEALADAKLHLFPMYANVTGCGPLLDTIRSCVSSDEPVILSMLVFPSFMTQAVAKSGVMPMPSDLELQGQPAGGHAVLVVGFDPNFVHCLNSWGSTWGQNGLFLIPVAYLSLMWQSQPAVMQLLTLLSVRKGYSLDQARADLDEITAKMASLTSKMKTL